jgi:adenine phosphoribosyltransferase
MWYTQYDYIAVVESRGFIIGSMLAARLNKGLVLLRSKPGRLPGKTALVKHTLEYGDSQMEVQQGKGKVLIFDDVIATGGTSQAAVDVLTDAGYTPVSALFLLQLNYLNPEVSVPYESVIHYNTQP